MKTQKTAEMPEQDLKCIAQGLDEAAKYGLEAEVVLSALTAMEDNPKLTIQEAFELGLNDWIK